MNLRFNTLLARLLIGSGIPLTLFLVVALIGVVAIMRLQHALWWERRTLEVLVQILKQREELRRMAVAVSAAPLAEVDAPEGQYRVNRRQFMHGYETLQALVEENQEQLVRLRNIRDWESEWHGRVEAEISELSTQPELPRGELVELRQQLTQRTAPLVENITREGDAFISTEQQLLDDRRHVIADETWQSVWLLGTSTVLAVGLSVAVLYFSARDVTRPIYRLRAATAEMLAGKFRVVPPSGPEEIAQMVTHFNHMGLTLTERTQLLQQQEDRYRTYIGASSNILWTANPVGQVIADIPAWRSFTGQTEEAVRGGGWLDALHPEDQPAARAAWEDAVSRAALFEGEYRLKAKSGDYRHVSCRAVPIPDASGKVREWIGTCTDVTEKVQEAGLRRAKEAAEAASRAKSEFLAKMSHELRTPLNAVIGMSKMLLTQRFGPINPKQIDYLQDIAGAGEHLLALINDILDLAKVESGKMDVHPESFRLNEAASSIAATLRPLAEAKGLALHLTTPESDGELSTDPGRFKQILYNLLSNAIKFTPQGSATVKFQWLSSLDRDAVVARPEEATAIRIDVADTGIGISPEDQTFVWAEFQQLKAGRSLDTGGTGLGLALTRRLVHLLGGTIGLESAVGEGSTFTVVLPRVAVKESIAPTPPQLNRPTALVIEDDAAGNKLMCDWLGEAGLNATAAFDGPAGLGLARQSRPQLIVLDIGLPGMDGWQVLTQLKSDPATATVPVVIVTMTDDKHPAQALDIQEYFVKPVGHEEFLERLLKIQPNLFESQRQTRVMIVDADETSRGALRTSLQREGVKVIEAASGGAALEQLHYDLPDVLVIDPLLPDVDGFALIEQVRTRSDGEALSILVVTAKELNESDRGRLNGNIRSVLAKRRLTQEGLHQYLGALGLVQL